jgi:hypothetical protein
VLSLDSGVKAWDDVWLEPLRSFEKVRARVPLVGLNQIGRLVSVVTWFSVSDGWDG